MSLKFENPCSFLLAGPSNVGKTFWILRLIKHLPQLCPQIKRIIFHYEVWQDVFNQFSNSITFHQGLPTLEDLKAAKNSLLILDDLMHADLNFLSKIFSIYSHHFKFSVVMTVQNLFHKNIREISLNAHVAVIFKHCRDVHQITVFLRQVFPKTFKEAFEAYKNAVSTARGYLIVDLRVDTADSQRLRTAIFPDEINYIYR